MTCRIHQDSTAWRAIAYMLTLPPAHPLLSSELAKQVGVTTRRLSEHLVSAVRQGYLRKHVPNSPNRRNGCAIYWSTGKPLPPRRPESPAHFREHYSKAHLTDNFRHVIVDARKVAPIKVKAVRSVFELAGA